MAGVVIARHCGRRHVAGPRRGARAAGRRRSGGEAAAVAARTSRSRLATRCRLREPHVERHCRLRRSESGVSVYDSYLSQSPGWRTYGGTSAAAPIVAGAIALAGNGTSTLPERSLHLRARRRAQRRDVGQQRHVRHVPLRCGRGLQRTGRKRLTQRSRRAIGRSAPDG